MQRFRLAWWKIIVIALLYYTVIGGMLLPVPRLPIMNETIRLNYFHVPMWFTMMFLFTFSIWYSIRYLNSNNMKDDDYAVEAVRIGFAFGILGLLTGMLWGNYTWGSFWPKKDMKIIGASIGLLIYSAYFVLRGSFQDDTQRARITAVYNIFAYAAFVPLIYILPRMVKDSLHPGSGNNPTFRLFDTSHNMKLVIYTAIIAFIALGYWITTISIRLRVLNKSAHEKV